MPIKKKKSPVRDDVKAVAKNNSQKGENKSNNNKSEKVPFPYLGTPDFRGYWI